MTIAADNSCPIPAPRKSWSKKRTLYPWRTMLIGESFPLRSSTWNSAKVTASYGNQYYYPRRFRAFETPEGFRCGRIA